MRGILAGGVMALALCGPAFAGPIVVDGNLADWGVSVGDNNTSNFTGAAVTGTVLDKTLYVTHEDQPDLAGDAYFLDPNYGGQNYDAEFMGVALLDDVLYLALVTGQRPDNGLMRFSPGDIRIVARSGKSGPVLAIYGIEVGGGPGGAANANALTDAGAPAGSTYTLASNGFTLSHAYNGRAVGSIWRDPDWLLDPLPPATAVQLAASGGTPVGTADYVYTRDAGPGSQHAVIELAFDRGIFGHASALDIYWAPSCGNDVLEIKDDLPGRVPEPGTLAVLALGLAGLRMVRRRR